VFKRSRPCPRLETEHAHTHTKIAYWAACRGHGRRMKWRVSPGPLTRHRNLRIRGLAIETSSVSSGGRTMDARRAILSPAWRVTVAARFMEQSEGSSITAPPSGIAATGPPSVHAVDVPNRAYRNQREATKARPSEDYNNSTATERTTPQQQVQQE
jgi:hypothetical protein